MKLIVGLGNPGPEYAQTRHNAGFMVLDRFAARRRFLDAGRPRHRFHSACLEDLIDGEKVVLLQPLTFMNRSGLAVGEAVTFFKADPARDLMIVVDDLALPAGRIRLRPSGSPGGHNGLADVQRALGSDLYPRLRIGIDPRGRVPQVDYVLGRFTPDQLDRLAPALDAAGQALDCWLRHGLDKAMSLFNNAPADAE